MDLLLGVLFLESIHKVKFGADRPLGSRRSRFHRFDNPARRTRDVGDVVDLLWAFGMDEDFDPRNLFTELMNVSGLKHLVYRAMPFPQDDPRGLNRFCGVASEFVFVWIPNGHLIVRDPHLQSSVSAQMLIWKEEDSLSLSEGPFQYSLRVAAGAYDATVLTAESFQARSTIDVGDWSEIGGVDDFAELLPCGFDLTDRSHVRHRATSRHVGQDNRHTLSAARLEFLRAVRQDVSGLSHKVDTAENDVSTVAAVGCQTTQLVRVACQVGVLNDFVLLIVVTEDQQA